MTHTGVFPALLGTDFGRLDTALRSVHGGQSITLDGSATVQRGYGRLAQLACRMASLPDSARNVPLRFRLEVEGQTEQWTRLFGSSLPMRSRIWARDRLLVEQLGPAVIRFEIFEEEGTLVWRAVSLKVFGIPMPRWAFDFRARVRGRGNEYRFEVDAHLALVGRLIGYQGELHVIQ